MSGGLSRLSTIIDTNRKHGGDLLFLNNGGLFKIPSKKDQELNARIGFNVLEHMKLDAMNMGPREFFLGTEYLGKMAEKVSFPFIATNIQNNGEYPWLKKYASFDMGGQHLVVLGILPEDAFRSSVFSKKVKDINIDDPAEAIQNVLHGFGDDVDIVILLSQLSSEKTNELVEKIPRINFAVTKSKRAECSMTKNPNQMVAQTGVNGLYYLSVNLKKEKKGNVAVVENDPIELSDSVKHDNTIDTIIVQSQKKAREISKHVTELVKKRLKENDVRALTMLTEKEFLQAVKKKKAELEKFHNNTSESLPSKTIVIDGKEVEGEILPGAKIVVEGGREIPATFRLIRGGARNNLKDKIKDEQDATKGEVVQ